MQIKKIFKKIVSALVIFMIVIELLVIGVVIYFRTTGGVPTIFGYNFYVIISPSMEPEICVGDVIISKQYEGQPLQAGQVITYLGKEGSLKNKIVTHKIISINETETGFEIITKGTANNSPDPAITEDDVISVMVTKSLLISFVYSLVSSPIGFIALIIIPLVILIVLEIVQLKSVVKDENSDDKIDEEEKDTQEENKEE